MRLLVYSDCVYRQADGVVYGEIAFAQFIAVLAGHVEHLTVVGRLHPEPGVSHYPLPSTVGFVGVPHYQSLTRPIAALRSLVRSLHRFWGALEDADCVWAFGPYLHAIALVVLGRLRRRAVVLGVRQDFPVYVRSRRPTLRWMHVAADALELVWRTLARWHPVVAVGPALASRYAHSTRLLTTTVSLISRDDIAAGERAANRSYLGELLLLSVGRLAREKNPLLLADAFALLRRADRRWRLIVCGDGPLQSSLEGRLAELGLADHAELRGYLPIRAGLLELYRASHAFLHVSWTEGMPQVLTEAFACGVPVVATAVGGVAAVGDGAAMLVAPGDPVAAATAVARLAEDSELRHRLIEAGFEHARQHTIERETRSVADFIEATLGPMRCRAQRSKSDRADSRGPQLP